MWDQLETFASQKFSSVMPIDYMEVNYINNFIAKVISLILKSICVFF